MQQLNVCILLIVNDVFNSCLSLFHEKAKLVDKKLFHFFGRNFL